MYEIQPQEQTYFGEQLDQIHQVYIKTSYGNIFAHAVGKHGQPLIIIVHGSGPRNSSDQYLYMLHEYLVRISYIEKFFIIAIDCPGYGRSKGSKEAVKTFPLQMFREILKDLNYTSYFAMLGHSQGGAAIFNAVYEDPKLTEFLLMDRPVCGNIKRFSKFPIPTLLVYDIEDDGHPLWQGKLLFKELLASEFYTYRASQHAYWVPDNIWNLILNLFKKYSTERKTLMSSNFSRSLLTHRSLSTRNRPAHKSNSKQKDKQGKQTKRSKQKESKKKSVSTSKYDKIKKQREQSEASLVEIQQIDRSELYSRVGDLGELEELPGWLNQPKQEQTEEEIKLEEENKKKLQEKLKKQIKIQDLDPSPVKKQNKKIEQPQIKPQQPKKSPQKQQKQPPKQTNTQTQTQDKCSICHENYYFPLQTNCKHIFCKKCLGESQLVDERCPLCRAKITKKSQKVQLHEKLVAAMDGKQRERRQRDLYQFQQMLKSIVYIEIGNTSRELATKQSAFTKTKKKYTWQLYAKEPKNFKFEQVSFNINMGNRDSVPVRVSHAPFTFESRSTFSFSCQIIIKPKNKDYAPITSIYRIDVEPGNHSKVIAVRKKKN